MRRYDIVAGSGQVEATVAAAVTAAAAAVAKARPVRSGLSRARKISRAAAVIATVAAQYLRVRRYDIVSASGQIEATVAAVAAAVAVARDRTGPTVRSGLV